jgi:hypothetical protein
VAGGQSSLAPPIISIVRRRRVIFGILWMASVRLDPQVLDWLLQRRRAPDPHQRYFDQPDGRRTAARVKELK